MNSQSLLKWFVVVVVVLVAAPFVPRLLPKPATPERARQAFEQAGLTVEQYQQAATPSLEAVAQTTMLVNGVRGGIYVYDNEGTIAKQLEYQKAGNERDAFGLVNLAQNLGAAPNRNLPSKAARNGKLMIVARGEDKQTIDRVIDLFTAL